MTDPSHVRRWVSAHPPSPTEVDCATTVMLKILDGKCKMKPLEKEVMTLLYDAVKHLTHQRFGADYHTLIAQARVVLDDATREVVYERRVLAETELSRPVMKRFKAHIRQTGLLDVGVALESDEGDAL